MFSNCNVCVTCNFYLILATYARKIHAYFYFSLKILIKIKTLLLTKSAHNNLTIVRENIIFCRAYTVACSRTHALICIRKNIQVRLCGNWSSSSWCCCHVINIFLQHAHEFLKCARLNRDLMKEKTTISYEVEVTENEGRGNPEEMTEAMRRREIKLMM